MPLIEADVLVKAAMEAVGTESPTELARALGLTDFSVPRNIKRWIDGENQPGFEATLALLHAAGMLNLEAPAPPAGAPADESAILTELRALDRKLDQQIVPKLDQIANAQRQADRSRTT